METVEIRVMGTVGALSEAGGLLGPGFTVESVRGPFPCRKPRERAKGWKRLYITATLTQNGLNQR